MDFAAIRPRWSKVRHWQEQTFEFSFAEYRRTEPSPEIDRQLSM
jgi:hypothetical protein